MATDARLSIRNPGARFKTSSVVETCTPRMSELPFDDSGKQMMPTSCSQGVTIEDSQYTISCPLMCPLSKGTDVTCTLTKHANR